MIAFFTCPYTTAWNGLSNTLPQPVYHVYYCPYPDSFREHSRRLSRISYTKIL